jgi:hypothetical protein
LDVTAAVENLSVESRRQAEPASCFKAEFPVAALNLHATKSPGWLPKQLEGRIQLKMSETSATMLEIKDPVQFRADLWRGRLNLAQQRILLHQEWIPQIDSWIPLDLGADASLNSSTASIVGQADLKVHVPNLQMSAGPVQLRLNDFNFRTGLAYGAGGTHSSVEFDSGWNRMALPSLPAGLQLTKVSQFQIDSSGKLSNVRLNSNRLKDPYQLLSGRPSLPSLESPHITFWVRGGWPASVNSSFMEVLGSRSNGIRLKGISGSINRFILEKGKITSFEGIASVSRIETPRGEGTLAQKSHFSIMAEKGSFLSLLDLGRNAAPLQSELSWDPSHLQLQLGKELELQGVLPALRPFLKQSGLDLDGVELAGTVRDLRASANFSASRLTGVSGRLDLGPDATAILELPTLRNSKPSKRWPQVEFHFDRRHRDSGGLFEFHLAADSERSDRYNLELSGGLRGFEAVAKTGPKSPHDLSLDTLASARFSFKAGKEFGPTSILSEAFSAGRGLWKQGQQASHILAPILAQSLEPRDLSWRIRMGNLSPSEPLLQFDSNSAALRLKAEALDLQWKGLDSRQNSVLSSAISFSMDLRPFRRHLVDDVFLDTSGTFSWNGYPTHRWQVQLPVQIALIDKLPPALDNPDLIWDSQFYKDFWHAYAQVYTEAHPFYLPNVTTIVLGPFSLQQIQGPLFPIQLAVGYEDRLQLHFPLHSRILFGEASGIGQLSIQWQEPDVLIDSFFNFELQHLQARAAGLSLQGQHVPVIDDELDGRMKFRTRQFRLPPEIVGRSQFPSLQTNLFKGFDLDFGLWKSTRSANLPGMLQLRTDVQLNLLNPVLNRIIRGWQFSYPPQQVPYQDMRFNLLVSDGRFLSVPPLLALTGVRLYSTAGLEFNGNVRLHWGWAKPAGDRGGSDIRGMLAFVQRYLWAGGI